MHDRVNRKLPLVGLLLAAWLVGGCSKVREPEQPATPGATAGQADSQTAGPQGPAPVITCAQATFDFGTVAQGEDAVHTFVIQNKGDGALKIDRARGG
jgi:hypothetical protein